MLAVQFYDVVLSVHIAAIVIAFGVTFAYPVLFPFLARQFPAALPAMHAAQETIGKRLIMPFGTLALLAGAYMATDRDLWSEVWVTVPLVILIVVLGMGGAFFSPNERRAAELAQRDVTSPEYVAVRNRIATAAIGANVLILVAIFFMVAKPFA